MYVSIQKQKNAHWIKAVVFTRPEFDPFHLVGVEN